MAEKATLFAKEAEAKATASTFGSMFGFAPSKQRNMEEAGELFVKAGNQYKVSNMHDKAAAMFLKASDSFKLGDGCDLQAINNLVEAATCFRKAKNNDECVRVLLQAVDVYAEQGKFGYVAKYQREVADIYLEDGNRSAALDFYQQAVMSFQNDNKPSKVTECKLKVATMCSENNEFTRAANVFEEIGLQSLENKLSSFSAKGYFLQSLLCHLAAGDSVAVRTKAEFFKSRDFSFGASREGLFMDKILEAFEGQNVEDFATHCAEFDRVTPLDPWKTSMLLKGKEHIEEKEDDLS